MKKKKLLISVIKVTLTNQRIKKTNTKFYERTANERHTSHFFQLEKKRKIVS